ncbi:hypothetical protein NM688_g7898 [Phlebia brevispora]|uniref:Uncharacterized protein n=1 Tax=Phlebia brevispora TaxID=194682 RepID=A0ACC1RZT8_9APHY|nr:hypothetical protein NM688_g7898 [Phlebia brevispora]
MSSITHVPPFSLLAFVLYLLFPVRCLIEACDVYTLGAIACNSGSSALAFDMAAHFIVQCVIVACYAVLTLVVASVVVMNFFLLLTSDCFPSIVRSLARTALKPHFESELLSFAAFTITWIVFTVMRHVILGRMDLLQQEQSERRTITTPTSPTPSCQPEPEVVWVKVLVKCASKGPTVGKRCQKQSIRRKLPQRRFRVKILLARYRRLLRSKRKMQEAHASNVALLHNDIRRSDNTVKGLRLVLARENQRRLSAQCAMNTSAEEMRLLRTALDGAKKINDSLQLQGASNQVVIDELKSVTSCLRSQLEAQQANHVAQVAEYNNQISGLQQTNSIQARLLENSEQQVSELQSTVNDLHNTCDSTSRSLDHERERNAALHAELLEMRRQNDVLRSTNTRLATELEQTRIAHRQDMAGKDVDIDILRKANVQLVDTSRDATAQMAELKESHNEEMNRVLAREEATTAELSETAKTVSLRVKTLEGELVVANQARAAAIEEANSLGARLNQLEAGKSAEIACVTTRFQSEASMLRRDLANKTRELKTVQSKLDTIEQDYRLASGELTMLEADTTSLCGQDHKSNSCVDNSLAGRIIAFGEIAHKHSEALGRLRDDYNALQAELAVSQAALEHEKGTLASVQAAYDKQAQDLHRARDARDSVKAQMGLLRLSHEEDMKCMSSDLQEALDKNAEQRKAAVEQAYQYEAIVIDKLGETDDLRVKQLQSLAYNLQEDLDFVQDDASRCKQKLAAQVEEAEVKVKEAEIRTKEAEARANDAQAKAQEERQARQEAENKLKALLNREKVSALSKPTACYPPTPALSPSSPASSIDSPALFTPPLSPSGGPIVCTGACASGPCVGLGLEM